MIFHSFDNIFNLIYYIFVAVIIVATMGGTFRKLMALAYEKGYHKGDYVFINIYYYEQRKVFGNFHWKQVTRTHCIYKFERSCHTILSHHDKIPVGLIP